MAIYIVEWSKGWSEVLAVHKWEDWAKTPVSNRSWYAEAIEARDELDAYMQATNREQTNEH
jgi:hypothetical protein